MKKSEIQIFLAHASEDKPAVFALYDRLKAAGYKPWLDKKDLIVGQNWRDEIPKVIKASHIFIACLSSKSVIKDGYIQEELWTALNTFGKMPSGTIYFIPMRLDKCEIPDLRLPEKKFKLKDLHWLDYWEVDAFEQLERAINHQFTFDPEESQKLDPEEPVIVTPSKSVFKFDVVFVNARGQEIKRESKQAEYFTEDLGNGIGLDMVAIPGDKFLMGSPKGEGHDDEKPQHQVTVQSFHMGKYPITQAQWRAIASRTDLEVERGLDINPAQFKDDDSDRRPVEMVSWYDAIEFCKRLSRLTEREYRLPSEAEWEYACRAGTTTPFYFGQTITGELANYDAKNTYYNESKGYYRGKTTPVGQFPPNSFGLYDMHGNVWEWCADTWHDNYEGAPTDGSAWTDNSELHVIRGGSWINNPWFCRSAYRLYNDFLNDYQGFRVVCVPPRNS